MFNYEPYVKSLLRYMLKHKYTAKPLPKVVLNKKTQKGLFISTGKYLPDNEIVVLYVKNRHPKDVLRSLAHEMIHHKQYVDGRLDANKCSDSLTNNKYIQPFEEEAYLKGNIAFRSWTEEFNKNK